MAAVLDFIGSIFGYILWFFFDLFDNYGLAILCFSIMIRILFFPMTLKGRVASAKSAKTLSKQNAIRKMYKNNPQKQTEEINKLLEKEGANAGFGSSFQSIFQLISVFGIFRAIVKPLTNMFHFKSDKVATAIAKLPSIANNALPLIKGYDQLNIVKCAPNNSSVFDMFNESEMSDILDFNKGFNFLGIDLSLTPKGSPLLSAVWLFPLFCLLSSILLAVINQKLGSMKDMPGCFKIIPYVTAIPFIFITINAPIAVGFYNLVTNMVLILETVVIHKFFSPKKLIAKEEAARISRLLIEEGNVKPK